MDIKAKPAAYLLCCRMERLRKITDVLLQSDNRSELDDTVLQLQSLLSAVSDRNDDPTDSTDSLSILLPVGEALPPRDAARCVIDSARTSKFLRGISAALVEAQRRFPDGPIEVLYAGCGPFATLAIPLATQFKTDQIQFTLLDIHARSLESAQRIIEAFGIRDYVREYIQGDAASYVHPRPLHMVITETMQRALSKEPQVAITLNLAPQLCPGGIFIPERVTIDAYLRDPQEEFGPGGRDRDESSWVTQREAGASIKLGRVFELSSEKAIELAWINGKRKCYTEGYLPATAIDLPKEMGEGLKLALTTTIVVFEMIMLGEYESGLTHPLWLFDFDRAKNGDRIEFQYRFDDNPGFKWQIPA